VLRLAALQPGGPAPLNLSGDEAARLLGLAEDAVTLKWKTYAEMATRGG